MVIVSVAVNRGATHALLDEKVIANSYGTTTSVNISGDGSVVFLVTDQALVGGDTNGKNDIYSYDVDSDVYELVSVDSSEDVSVDGNDTYGNIESSSDGRYVVFSTNVSDLVADDINGFYDIYLRDRIAGTTVRISLNSDEEELNASAYDPSVSDDGRYVVFNSIATDVVAGDTNSTRDVFLRDVVAGTTDRISVDSSEVELTGGASSVQNKSISADGRFVVFSSYATNAVAGDTNGNGDVFIRDLVDGTTERISLDSDGVQLPQTSWAGSFPSNGEYVTFRTQASAQEQDTNSVMDVYIRNLSTGTNQLVSKNIDNEVGDQHSQLLINNLYTSNDARFVLFVSNATNFIEGYTPPFGPYSLYIKDMTSGEVELVNDEINQQSFWMSEDGKKVVFINGDNELVLAATVSSVPVVPSNIVLEGGGTETSDSTPSFGGDCAIGDLITLYINGVSTGITSVCNSFNITSGKLSTGEYSISFTATRLGVESAQSEVLGIAISAETGEPTEDTLAESGLPVVVFLLIGSLVSIASISLRLNSRY